jgi:hypothetical protein
MSPGWSWDPASVLGTLNTNRLPVIQNVADGPRPTGFVPVSAGSSHSPLARPPNLLTVAILTI